MCVGIDPEFEARTESGLQEVQVLFPYSHKARIPSDRRHLIFYDILPCQLYRVSVPRACVTPVYCTSKKRSVYVDQDQYWMGVRVGKHTVSIR